jgi:hypothetical protein
VDVTITQQHDRIEQSGAIAQTERLSSTLGLSDAIAIRSTHGSCACSGNSEQCTDTCLLLCRLKPHACNQQISLTENKIFDTGILYKAKIPLRFSVKNLSEQLLSVPGRWPSPFARSNKEYSRHHPFHDGEYINTTITARIKRASHYM